MSISVSITKEEADLYDRQIRLWGLEAQSRLKNSKILLIGVSPVSSEIIKNLVLVGINTLTLADDQLVSEEDLELNFLYQKHNLEQWRTASALNRAQMLNGMVHINCENTTCTKELSLKYNYYDELIVALDFHKNIIGDWVSFINEFSASTKRPNIHCIFTVGMHAIGFADLGNYEYECVDTQSAGLSSNKPNSNEISSNRTSKASKVIYPALEEVLKMSWNGSHSVKTQPKRMPTGFYLLHTLVALTGPLSIDNLQNAWSVVSSRLGVPSSLLTLDDFESCCGPPLVAVNAIIGGIISQEIIEGLSRKGVPKGNWYFVDGRSCKANVLWLPQIQE